jgi:hypothetical protein
MLTSPSHYGHKRQFPLLTQVKEIYFDSGPTRLVIANGIHFGKNYVSRASSEEYHWIDLDECMLLHVKLSQI